MNEGDDNTGSKRKKGGRRLEEINSLQDNSNTVESKPTDIESGSPLPRPGKDHCTLNYKTECFCKRVYIFKNVINLQVQNQLVLIQLMVGALKCCW